jgi:hypothetical protein
MPKLSRDTWRLEMIKELPIKLGVPMYMYKRRKLGFCNYCTEAWTTD